MSPPAPTSGFGKAECCYCPPGSNSATIESAVLVMLLMKDNLKNGHRDNTIHQECAIDFCPIY
jgi:hypothetical protein